MVNVDLKMLVKRLNRYCTGCLEGAAGLCVSHGGYEVGIAHLLLKLLQDPLGDFQQILNHFEIDVSHVQKTLSHRVEEEGSGNSGRPVFSPQLLEWIQDGWVVSSIEMGLEEIRSAALITALLTNPSRYNFITVTDTLRAIRVDELRREWLTITGNSTENGPERGAIVASPLAGEGSALARFTVSFTEKAACGEIDPVFCRDQEIRQMIDILGRRRKNNPIVVGEPGVGKSAVVEGLALKVAEGDVPDLLKGVDIIALDLALLQAGASIKGEFENRLKSVINEVNSSPRPIILFIDEAHTLIGAGGMAGGGDAANLLKPALARGELRTIAATTWSEYKKYFEKDPALARRFQRVRLEEPSPDEAVTIIRGLRHTYEKAHGVYVRDDAVEAAARLSARYISGRQLPDKAVDVLDTAAARVKISLSSKPDAIDMHERTIQTLKRERSAIQRDLDQGVKEDEGAVGLVEKRITGIEREIAEMTRRWEQERALAERIIQLRATLAGEMDNQAASEERGEGGEGEKRVDKEALRGELEAQLIALRQAQQDGQLLHYEVSPAVVGKVIADWTGIPLGKMVRDEAQLALRFCAEMNKRIKGQPDAMDAIDQGVRAAKAGLGNPDAPMGVFLLVGPSGVGKTESALGVADILFGGERFMTTINMSEFQEKQSLSRLIGSPPGYVGYGEGGVLTEAVRQRPYSVVLLDEVEKGELEVMNLFYQVFDKGVLSDGEGRQIDFKNTIVILTSNLASDIISEMCRGDKAPTPEQLIEEIRPVLSNHFKPALLARMKIVPFYPIPGEVMGEIVSIKLGELGDRLRNSQKVDFSFSGAVVATIAQRCTEVESGARNVDQIINHSLLPRISTELLERMVGEKAPVRLKVEMDEGGDFQLQFS
jgi:type VI secretion system protein VasG